MREHAIGEQDQLRLWSATMHATHQVVEIAVVKAHHRTVEKSRSIQQRRVGFLINQCVRKISSQRLSDYEVREVTAGGKQNIFRLEKIRQCVFELEVNGVIARGLTRSGHI